MLQEELKRYMCCKLKLAKYDTFGSLDCIFSNFQNCAVQYVANVLLMIFYYPCLKLFSISKLAYLSFEEHKNMSEIVNGAEKDIKRKSYTDPNRDFISQF